MILTLRFYEITANKFNKQVGKMEYLSGMLRRKASYRKRFALEKNRLFHQPVADQSIRFHRATFLSLSGKNQAAASYRVRTNLSKFSSAKKNFKNLWKILKKKERKKESKE